MLPAHDTQTCPDCQHWIAKCLEAATDWVVTPKGLIKTFTFGNRRELAAFIARLKASENTANHHSDLETTGDSVTVLYCTHSAGDAVTELDYTSTQTADEIAKTYRAASGPLPLRSELLQPMRRKRKRRKEFDVERVARYLLALRLAGGKGSGHHGHKGRPGKVGGSSGDLFRDYVDSVKGPVKPGTPWLDDQGNRIGVTSDTSGSTGLQKFDPLPAEANEPKGFFDFQSIINRHFLFNPKDQRILLGSEVSPDNPSLNEETHADVADKLGVIGREFDQFKVRGFIQREESEYFGGQTPGTSQRMKVKVTFVPTHDPIEQSDSLHALYEKIKVNGATDDTLIDIGWGGRPLKERMRHLGGRGSGHHGHAGRPGKRGGSTAAFHGTVAKNVASILKTGLTSWSDVWVTTSLKEAEMYAKTRAADARGKPVIVKLAIPKAHVSSFKQDDETSFNAFYREETIPPEWIIDIVTPTGKSVMPKRPKTLEMSDEQIAYAIVFVDDLDEDDRLETLGGAGSGFHGHAGRPGKVGGSGSSAVGEIDLADAVEILSSYVTEGSFMYGGPNDKLRAHDQGILKDERVQRMDSLMSPLSREMTLYRVTDHVLDLKVGDVFTDHGFVSTSASYGALKQIMEDLSLDDLPARGHAVQRITIRARPKTKVVAVNEVLGPTHQYAYQKEYVLNRGTRFRVMNKDSRGDLWVETIP